MATGAVHVQDEFEMVDGVYPCDPVFVDKDCVEPGEPIGRDPPGPERGQGRRLGERLQCRGVCAPSAFSDLHPEIEAVAVELDSLMHDVRFPALPRHPSQLSS